MVLTCNSPSGNPLNQVPEILFPPRSPYFYLYYMYYVYLTAKVDVANLNLFSLLHTNWIPLNSNPQKLWISDFLTNKVNKKNQKQRHGVNQIKMQIGLAETPPITCPSVPPSVKNRALPLLLIQTKTDDGLEWKCHSWVVSFIMEISGENPWRHATNFHRCSLPSLYPLGRVEF